MQIKTVEFVKSIVNLRDYRDYTYPELVFLGRSNVGKSSLINVLINRKNMAITSSTPGRTQAINLFDVDNRFHLVDLPGFGYAKAGKEVQKKWQALIIPYLKKSDQIRLIHYLFDIRRTPTAEDISIFHRILAIGHPITLVLTKADKLSNNQKQNQLHKISEAFAIDPEDITLFSSKSKLGKVKLLAIIEQMLDADAV